MSDITTEAHKGNFADWWDASTEEQKQLYLEKIREFYFPSLFTLLKEMVCAGYQRLRKGSR